jgi:hypothetical protein
MIARSVSAIVLELPHAAPLPPPSKLSHELTQPTHAHTLVKEEQARFAMTISLDAHGGYIFSSLLIPSNKLTYKVTSP